jgi:hypothetical protein
MDKHEEFNKEFLPKVHRAGITTMVLALVFATLPTIYFVFIKGIKVELSSFLAVVGAIATFSIGMWISEPAAFWPVLGSAGTYVAFLAGNASSMRLPVALTARSSLEDGNDLENPKVHIAMIIALFASVWVNLAILICIVFAGDLIIAALPATVFAAFSYVMPCLVANNIMLQLRDKAGKFIPGIKSSWPYIAAGLAVKLITKYWLTGLANWAILIAVVVAALVAYVFYLRDCKADEEAEKAAK